MPDDVSDRLLDFLYRTASYSLAEAMSEAGVGTVEELEYGLKVLVEQDYLESWDMNMEEGIVRVTFSRTYLRDHPRR